MTKARILAQVVSAGNILADGQINVEDIVGLDISAGELLNKLKTVDGSGSGLDADLIDGLDSSIFSRVPVVNNVTTGTYSAVATYGTQILLCNTSSNNITINLPTAISNNATYVIKKIASTNSMIIDPSGTETIDGSTSVTITVENTCLTLISDGSNWRII